MPKKTWVLVANGTQARIFFPEKNKQLIEFKCLTHPEGRLHSRDLTTDRAGRTNDSLGHHRHMIEPTVTPQQLEITLFAREVSEHLNAARANQEFNRLYILANPSFMGTLRKMLSGETTRVVAQEITKDVTWLKPDEIREYLPPVI